MLVVAAVSLCAAVVLPVLLAEMMVPGRGGAGVLEGTVWVANERSDSITGIDAGTHEVVTVLRGIATPHNVQVAPDGRALWATSGKGLVAAIDTDTQTVEEAVFTGESPAHVIVTPDGARALATNMGDDTLSVLDAKHPQLLHTRTTGPMPHGLRPSPDGRLALVADLEGTTVGLHDTATGRRLDTIEVGRSPVQVAYSHDGRHGYVSLNEDDAVVKIDLAGRRVVGRAKVAPGPVQVYLTPDGQTLAVASQGTTAEPGDSLTLLDTASLRVKAVLTTGQGAHGVVIDPSGRQAFVTNVWDGTVSVVDLTTRTVVDHVEVGGAPNGISFSTVRQEHAHGAANGGSPLVATLALGGRTDGGGSTTGHQH